MKYGKTRINFDFIEIIKKNPERHSFFAVIASSNEVNYMTVVKWFETNDVTLTTKHNSELIRIFLKLEPGENIFTTFK
jgi:hypothetical protein